MSDADAKGPAPGVSEASVPEGLVSAVVNLVNTGPVLLGAYTIAELTAVDAIVDFLEARPSDEALTEAVRSLAARQLIVAGPPGEQVQVRGDLGIAVARIDTFGVHQIGLYKLDEAVRLLTAWLPRGPRADPHPAVESDGMLASSERSALVTVTHYTTQGSAEIAGASTDLILARHDGRLHLFSRDPDDRARLVPGPRDGKDVHDTLVDMLTLSAAPSRGQQPLALRPARPGAVIQASHDLLDRAGRVTGCQGSPGKADPWLAALLAGAGLLRPGACGQDGGMARPEPRHDRDAGGPADVLAAKAALRQEVWSRMRAARVARFPGAAGRIPNFTGAEAAAERLRATPVWQAASTLKANPDSAQLPVRQRALEDGKTVYMAVPRLAGREPFFALEPGHLSESPRKAASISGAARSARRVTLAELSPVDLVVMGCVAAGEDGARLGKGGGFADLEFALATAGGLIGPHTVSVTTVHELQVHAAGTIPLTGHDVPVDFIITPERVIDCRSRHGPRPAAGICWEDLTEEKIAAIPLLAAQRPGRRSTRTPHTARPARARGRQRPAGHT